MPRNKHPEVTEQRILDAATKLFLEKGWDETTIQDIIDELGDLTRGAFYHHFKSKFEIIDAVSTRLFLYHNPFDQVRERRDLNGLQKLREAFMVAAGEPGYLNLEHGVPQALTSPQVVARQVEDCVKTLAPFMLEFIEEGVADGSLQVAYPKQAAESLSLLVNVWLSPLLFPVGREEFIAKVRHFGLLSAAIGLPFFDEGLLAVYLTAYQRLFQETQAGEAD